MPEVKPLYAKMTPEDRNRIIYLENRIKVLNAFNEFNDLTYSDALKKARMIGKDRTFASHLKKLVEDGLVVRKEVRKYHISEKGRMAIPALSRQIEDIRKSWNLSRLRTEGIPDHTIIVNSGEVTLPTARANQVNAQESPSPTYSYFGSLRMSSYSYIPKKDKDFVLFDKSHEASEAMRVVAEAIVPKLPVVDRFDLSLTLIKKRKGSE